MPTLKVSEICKYNDCTGCMACQSICSHNAIYFTTDNEGFLRPTINSDLCVGCQLCVAICPINSPSKKNSPQKSFCGWNNDDSIRLSSSSGGVFHELAKAVILQGGVVFGCAMSNTNGAEHRYVKTIDGIKELQGSKYIQSTIGNSYINAKEFLSKDIPVLFSGTPCQIAGLLNYLRKPYPNLITIDIVCHGVPSPKVFNDYKTYIQKKYRLNNLKHIRFRDKKFSWIYFNMAIEDFANNQYIGKYYDDPYIRGFLRDLFLRPSCHFCKYTTINRVSDITLADWWGYKPINHKDFDSLQKGVSLILPSTDKGVELIKSCNLCLRERSIDEALNTNRALSSSFPPAPNRAHFWDDYSAMTFQQIIEKYMYPEYLSPTKRLQYNFPSSTLVNLLVRLKYKFEEIFKIKKRIK